MRHSWCLMVAALLVSGCDSGDSPVDTAGRGGSSAGRGGEHPAGQDAGSCSGSHGQKLTCDSAGAVALTGARYDAARRCFQPREMLPDYCAVPTYCPGGDGELICVIDPSGNAYGTYVLFGEELTDPNWHHAATRVLGATLTGSDESKLCAELLATYAGTTAPPGTKSEERALRVASSPVQVSPICK